MKSIKNFKIVIALLLAFNLVAYLFRIGGDTIMQYISNIQPVIYSLITVIMLFKSFSAFKVKDYPKIAWFMIFSGLVLNLMAETIYAILELACKTNMNEVFPTLADYFWCSAYLPIIIGLVMMYIGYKKSGLTLENEKAYIILAPIIIVFMGIIFYFVLLPLIEDNDTNTIEKIFYLFYPVADMFIVVPSIILVFITRLFGKGTISQPWKFLALGFILFTFSDLLYSYLSWQELYGDGNFIDLGWNLGYLLIGLAALYQKNLIESINEN